MGLDPAGRGLTRSDPDHVCQDQVAPEPLGSVRRRGLREAASLRTPLLMLAVRRRGRQAGDTSPPASPSWALSPEPRGRGGSAPQPGPPPGPVLGDPCPRRWRSALFSLLVWRFPQFPGLLFFLGVGVGETQAERSEGHVVGSLLQSGVHRPHASSRDPSQATGGPTKPGYDNEHAFRVLSPPHVTTGTVLGGSPSIGGPVSCPAPQPCP